jgi:hypothetical protein
MSQHEERDEMLGQRRRCWAAMTSMPYSAVVFTTADRKEARPRPEQLEWTYMADWLEGLRERLDHATRVDLATLDKLYRLQTERAALGEYLRAAMAAPDTEKLTIAHRLLVSQLIELSRKETEKK